MGANQDGRQAAVILVLTMVGAAANSALDALVGGIVHDLFLLRERCWLSAGSSVCQKEKLMYEENRGTLVPRFHV